MAPHLRPISASRSGRFPINSGNTDGIVRLRRPGRSVWFDSAVAADVEEVGFFDGEPKSSPVGHCQGRTLHPIYELRGGGKLMWKRCQRGGVLAKLIRDRYTSSKRFLKELVDSRRAIGDGLRVSEVLGFASIPAGRGLVRVEMLVRFEEGYEQLAEVLADPSTDWRTRVNVLTRTGDALRSFHGCGFLHGDLNLMNILINRKPGSPVRVLLIDIDPGGLPPHGSARQNLLRLATSHRKLVRSGMPSVSSVEALRFLNAYFGCDRTRLLETWDRFKLTLEGLNKWDRFKPPLSRKSR